MVEIEWVLNSFLRIQGEEWIQVALGSLQEMEIPYSAVDNKHNISIRDQITNHCIDVVGNEMFRFAEAKWPRCINEVFQGAYAELVRAKRGRLCVITYACLQVSSVEYAETDLIFPILVKLRNIRILHIDANNQQIFDTRVRQIVS